MLLDAKLWKKFGPTRGGIPEHRVGGAFYAVNSLASAGSSGKTLAIMNSGPVHPGCAGSKTLVIAGINRGYSKIQPYPVPFVELTPIPSPDPKPRSTQEITPPHVHPTVYSPGAAFAGSISTREKLHSEFSSISMKRLGTQNPFQASIRISRDMLH